MNKDYIKGMRLLLRMAKTMGYNIRKYQWIPYFCQFLSTHGACEKFWVGVQEQNTLGSLDRIVNTMYSYTLPLTPRVLINYLIGWSRTKDGELFWSNVSVDGSFIILK
jgi:hypothetical protein